MRTITSLFVALLAAQPLPASAQLVGTDALPLEPCHLSIPQTTARVAARCGELHVAENPADPNGRRIGIAVAVIPATTAKRVDDPFVFITGGPGQAATESFVTVAGAFQRINRERDILLVDQRGTGGSNRLGCTEPDDFDPAAADADMRRAWLERCLAELPGDPRFYTTSVAIRDLDAVREALGYELLNLYGVSYGTRVAQAYARRYPERVRSVVLDGVVPMDLALGPGISLDAQRALELIFARCAASDDCAAAFPGLRERFARLQATLRTDPVQLVLADPTSGELTEQVFTEEYFRGIVRMFSYAPETVALLPLLIDHTARTGDFVPLAAQALLITRQLGESIAGGMHNSVVCTEDIPFIADDAALRDSLDATYLGTNTLEYLSEACAVWPQGVMDDGFKQPWSSDIPTLLLSGETDPVTPPVNGDRVAAALGNALHLVGPGQGHGLIVRGCVPRVVTRFVSAGTIEGLDAGCIEELRPMPFFLRFTGPAP